VGCLGLEVFGCGVDCLVSVGVEYVLADELFGEYCWWYVVDDGECV